MNATPPPRIGVWTATALVVGNMIGSGLFLLPSSLAGFGAASLLGWAVSAVGALLLALVFARFGQLLPVTGGPYAYARASFGDLAGFIVGWSYWISTWSSVAAIAIAFTGYAGSLLPPLTATPWRAALCSIAALWLCTFLNLFGLRTAGGVQLTTTLFKVGALLVFAVLGLSYAEPAHFTPFNPGGGSLLQVTTATAALTLWAFLGLESATVPASAVHDAARTVPRATLLGTLIAIVVTIAACLAVAGVIPADQLKTSTAPFADATQRLLGSGAARVVALVAAVACFGALNGWVLILGQMPLAIARDGLFPAVFARTDSQATPRHGLVIGAVLASVLIAANASASLVAVFTWSILLSTAACLIPYLVCALALVWREPRQLSLRAAALLAAGYSAWALYGTGNESLRWGAGLLLAGLPVYLWQRLLLRRSAAASRVA